MVDFKEDNEVSCVVFEGTHKAEAEEVYLKLIEFKNHPKRSAFIERFLACHKAADENEIWTDSEKEELRAAETPPVTLPNLMIGIRGSSAIVTDSKPGINFLPTGGGDLYVAELLKLAHNVVWRKNEGSDTIFEGVKEVKTGGLVFFNSFLNKNKGLWGRVEFEVEDPLDYYYDPESKKNDFSDTDIIKAKLRTKKYLKERYDVKDEDLDYEFIPLDDTSESSISTGVIGADNYAIAESSGKHSTSGQSLEKGAAWEIEAWLRFVEKEVNLFSVPDGQEAAVHRRFSGDELKQFEDAEDKDLYIKKSFGGFAKPLIRYVEKRKFVKIVGRKVIEVIVNPYGEDGDGDPIIGPTGLRGHKVRKNFPMSDTAFAKDIAKSASKKHMQGIAAANDSIASPIMEPAGQVKWVDKNGKKGKAGNPGTHAQIDKTAAFQPYRLGTGNLDFNALSMQESQAGKYVDDIYAFTDVMQGKAPVGVENPSGRMVIALQDLAGISSKPFLRSLEAAMERLAKTNMAIMLKFWTREQWEKLIDDTAYRFYRPDGNLEVTDKEDIIPEEQEVIDEIGRKWEDALDKVSPAKGDGMTMLDIDVVITAGSSMPTNRMAKASFAMEMARAGAYDPEAVLDAVDDPGKDKIIKRIRRQQMMAGSQGK